MALSCGEHTCSLKCHRLLDHSDVPCEVRVSSVCDEDHETWNLCHLSKTSPCIHCSTEKTKADNAARREADRRIKRDADQAAQDAIDAELAAEPELQRDKDEAGERERELTRKQKLLDDLKAKREPEDGFSSISEEVSDAQAPADSDTSPYPPLPPAPEIYDVDLPFPSAATPDLSTVALDGSPPVLPPSPAEAEWIRQKQAEDAENTHIDKLMSMVGLEKVKWQFLEIKAELETSQRQGVSMDKKNLNAVLLGNPGTGELLPVNTSTFWCIIIH